MPIRPTRLSTRRPRLLAAVSLCAIAAGCAASPAARPGQIEHVVVVWLRQPGDAALIERMSATARSFCGEIPGLLSVDCGTPVPSDSPLVDDGFDLGMVMRFADREALAGYAVHPVHLRAVEEVLLPNAERVLVYDVEIR